MVRSLIFGWETRTSIEYFGRWLILICGLSEKTYYFFCFCIFQFAFVVCLKLFSHILILEPADLLVLTLSLFFSWPDFQIFSVQGLNFRLNSNWLNDQFEPSPDQHDSFPGFALLVVSMHQPLDFVLHACLMANAYYKEILVCLHSPIFHPKIDYFSKDCKNYRQI